MASFTIEKVEQLIVDFYGYKGMLKPLPGFEDSNYLLETSKQGRFVFKIYHTEEEQASLEAQNAMLSHLANHAPFLETPKVVPSNNGKGLAVFQDENGNSRFIRMLTWVEGRLFAKVNPHSPVLLKSLGRTVGRLCEGLKGFDHPAAHRFFKWDITQVAWTKEYFHLIKDEHNRTTALYFYELFEKNALPLLNTLRKSVLQNDANDFNILVNDNLHDPSVKSIIDFGDFVYAPTVNEVAVAIAYAAMDKPDPLEAAKNVLEGMHEIFPLEEKELSILYFLIAARLVISVTFSAINIHENPNNKYLQISDRQAWDLLKKWKNISPTLAHYTFRDACCVPPCPHILPEINHAVFPVDVFNKKIMHLDLSVGSLDLGNYENYVSIKNFEKTIERILEENNAEIGIGGYGEARPFYTTDAYKTEGNNGPRWRTTHLGLDIWASSGTPVFAPLDGHIFSFQDNAGERDYGPTIILKHEINGVIFYSLYGHLNKKSLPDLNKGQFFKKGEKIAEIGPAPENGNWPPHLHFQLMLDLLGNEGDFPGVAFPSEKNIWLSICPDPMFLFPKINFENKTIEINSGEIIDKRKKLLPPNLSISYKKHLTMLRGMGQYLLDETGRRYLDTVNNVAHVGHEHPAVVRAAQRQNAVLNTNTRYLHPNIIQFAAELLATFPAPLEVAFFVNSGSEATELGIRLARTYTGRHDLIPVSSAYHGNTGLCVDISSYKFDGPGGKGAPDFVKVAPMPDPVRGIYKNEKEEGKKYASHIKSMVSKNTAAFICESILSCGGQIVLPENYLEEAYKIMRAAGGLCIADEVQTGVGRVGSHFWAFELQGVVPDIVTIGKPIGNGHPLAAVVTTREIAAAFANGMEYFNTFGGNPVSCAIGSEVLKVVKEEGLQENANEMGRYLMEGFAELAREFPIIADLRGHGLFFGYELVRPTAKDPHYPAAEQASYLSNRLRDLGILSSTDGPLHNVIKIKPPLVFDKDNADFLLETTKRVLSEDFMKV